VSDAGEPPLQLDRGRQLAALLEDGADRGGIRLGDDKSYGKHAPPLIQIKTRDRCTR
jgi:hypothetical protein